MAKRNGNRKSNKNKNRIAPIKYSKKSIERQTTQQRLQFEDDTPDAKEHIPIHTDESDKYFLETLREFENLTSTYELWTMEADSIVFTRFRRCLKEIARDSWDSIIEGRNKTQNKFEEFIVSPSEEVIGLDAEENQKEYFKKILQNQESQTHQQFDSINGRGNYRPVDQNIDQRSHHRECAVYVENTLESSKSTSFGQSCESLATTRSIRRGTSRVG